MAGAPSGLAKSSTLAIEASLCGKSTIRSRTFASMCRWEVHERSWVSAQYHSPPIKHLGM
eukprot:361367-Chlamydomonas_euryale.AAC.5